LIIWRQGKALHLISYEYIYLFYPPFGDVRGEVETAEEEVAEALLVVAGEVLLLAFIIGGMALSACVDIPVGGTGAVTFSLVNALAEVTFSANAFR
jgi:hypothetical protein